MAKQAPFTLPAAVAASLVGRTFDPIIDLEYDMAAPETKEFVLPENGLACIAFDTAGGVGSVLDVRVSPQPITANNPQGNMIYSVTQANGDFSHNAVASFGGGIQFQIIAKGATAPRGVLGIVAGSYVLNIARQLPFPCEGGLRVQLNPTLK